MDRAAPVRLPMPPHTQPRRPSLQLPVPTMTAAHRTPTYRAWAAKVIKHCEPVCIRCGYPVDMSLPRTHPDGASADHEPPFAITGEIAPSLDDGSGISHLRCNKQHGGKLGSQRAQQRHKRSLGDKQSTPPAPSSSSPKTGTKRPREAREAPRMHPDGFVLPRLESARSGRVVGSLGGECAEWVKTHLNMDLRGWQRYALDRALEVDADGALVWSHVICTVGRQSGKSWLSRAVCMWRIHQADRFGEEQTVLHVANKTQTALEVMRPAALWAMNTYGKKSVKLGNTAPGITLPTGDRWLVQAANDSSGVGYSVSMVFIDEAWRVRREVLDDALEPTMAERNQTQAWLVSTAGDSESELMATYRSRAIEQLSDPDGILLLEWSAPADAPPEDVDTWRYGSPEWSDRRERFLRERFAVVEEEAFRRQFLNQWTISANHWLRDSWWKATLEPGALPTSGEWIVACESEFDGMAHAVAVAAVDPEGTVHVRMWTHRTIREADERIAQLRAQHRRIMVLATPGYVDRLQSNIDALVGQREAAAATQNLLDLFERKAIRHDGDQALHEQMLGTTIARRQAGWVLTAPQGKGGVFGARAVMFAAWQATKAPRPVAVIRSARRRA